MSYCMIMTTTGSQDEAESLAAILIKEQLAACVQITAITSMYNWQGNLHNDAEYLLLIKTSANLYGQVEDAILKHHSYDTPEIIQVPITQGSIPYLTWMDATTQRDH